MAHICKGRYAMTSESAPKSVPPYIAFGTFTNLIEGMSGTALPPRIDRSLLANHSGGHQAQILSALRYLELIDQQHSVLPSLRALVDEPDKSQGLMAAIIKRHYGPVLELSAASGTQGQLEELFREMGVKGSTLRKAIAFFLKACSYADIEVSEHFKVPRVTAATRKPRHKPVTTDAEAVNTADLPNTKTVQLRSGGSVSIGLNLDLFNLDEHDHAFVMNLVTSVKNYGLEDAAALKK